MIPALRRARSAAEAMWSRRAARERGLILTLGLVLGAYGLLVWVWGPMRAARAEALASIARYEAVLPLLAAAPAGLPVSGIQGGDEPVASILTATAPERGIEISRIEPDAQGAIALCGGGEATMQGMRSFVRGHRKEIDKRATRFVSFESVGRGDPRFALSQGPAVSVPLDTDLAELCAAVAIAHDSGEDKYDAEPIRDGRPSAALTARAYGYPAISITCREGREALPTGHHTPADLPDQVDPAAVGRAASFAVEVVRLLDRDLGRTTPRAAAEPAVTSAG